MFGRIQIQRCNSFWFTSSCFQIQTRPTRDGQFTLSGIPALAGFAQRQWGWLDWSARSQRAHGVFNGPSLGQRAPVLPTCRIPGRAPMETHESEAGWVNGLLYCPWKIGIFGGLEDFARALALLKFLHLWGKRFSASLLWWLRFRHDNLRFLLRDGMEVSCSDTRACLFHMAVFVVVWRGGRGRARGGGIWRGGRRARWRTTGLGSLRHIFLKLQKATVNIEFYWVQSRQGVSLTSVLTRIFRGRPLGLFPRLRNRSSFSCSLQYQSFR